MFLTKDSKSQYYQIVYFVNGRRTKKSTKQTSKEEAQEVLEEFKNNFNPDDTPPPPNKRNIKNNIVTLSIFKLEYITYSDQTKSKSYIKRSIEPAFKFFLEFIGDEPINKIGVKNIDQFITSTYARSKSSASLYYRTLKAAFSKAVAWEYLQDNPFRKIKTPKQLKSFPCFINEAELIKICNVTESELLKNIFTTAFYTGMRLGELLNMKWNWINFKDEIITIKNSAEFTSKSKQERIIPIHPKIKIILQSIYPIGKNSDNDFIFLRYPGIKVNEDYVSKQFKKAVIAAELNDKIHFHSLRHSFASGLVQRGVPLEIIKEILGHQDLRTTQIYSHLQKQNLAQAVNLL